MPNSPSSGGLVRIEGSQATFECGAADTLLAAALKSGLGLPYECSSGGCGSCKIDLLEGDLEVLRADAPGLKPREWNRGKRLACQSRPIGDCTIRFRQDSAYVPIVKPRRLTARLVAKRMLTHDLYEFGFRGDSPADFLPGQYALMHLAGVNGPRAYSMSNLRNEDGYWEFVIKRVPDGQATNYLFDGLEVSDVISLEAPFSIAHLRTGNLRGITCIAGGSGLAPMLSIIRGAAATPELAKARLRLYYGGREPRDIVELAGLNLPSGCTDRLEYVPVISDGKSTEAPSWKGPRGFVHQVAADQLGPEASSQDYYLAGPPPMVEAARRMLILEKSIPIEQVHYDRFF